MVPFRALLGSIFACGLVLAACSQAYCTEIDEATVRRLARPGAFSADLRGKAAFRVPDKFRMVTEDKLVEFAEILNVTLIGDEVGVVLPNDKNGWLCLVLLPKEDPLKGFDKKNLTEPAVRDALMQWQRDFVEARRNRVGKGTQSAKVVGWTHPPAYDAEKKRLIMGVRMEPENGNSRSAVVSYQIYQYGNDDDIVCLNTMTTSDSWDKAVPEVQKLAGEITFLNRPTAETVEPANLMYYGQIAGGGIVGAIVVMFLFRKLSASKSSSSPRAQRRTPSMRSGN